MVTWFSFPAASGISLKFRRHEGKLHYVLDLQSHRGTLPAELTEMGWVSDATNPRLLTHPFPDKGNNVLPLAFFSRVQAYRNSYDISTPGARQRFADHHGLHDCPDGGQSIGHNREGEPVYEHQGHRWIDGRSWFNHESLYPPAKALRFARREDYVQLARRITENSLRTGQHYKRSALEELARRTVAPCPSRPGFQPATEAHKARDWLMGDLFLQICQSPIHAGETRAWNDLVRLQKTIELDLMPSGGLSPLLTQATREVLKMTRNFPTTGIAPVRFQLHENDALPRETSHQPEHAADTLIVQGTNPMEADRFFLDLRDWPVAEAGDALLAHLALRRDKGVSAVLLPAGDDIEGELEAMAILRDVACAHGIEASCRISPSMAEQQNEGATGLLAVAVGDKRPERLAIAPAAALRCPEAQTSQELQRWYYEARHGRQRLMELHTGTEPEIMRYRQVPYQSLSQTGVARTMIAKGHQQAFDRAKEKFITARGQDVDDYVSSLLGLDRPELEERFSPEQIDAIALSQWAHERGRSFILADQTGAGKGRSMIGAAATWLHSHPRNRVLYFTKSTSLMRDVLRDVADTKTGDLIGRVGLVGSKLPSETVQPVTRYTNERKIDGIGARSRLFLTGAWPEGNRMVITTYSSFQLVDMDGHDDNPAREWINNISGDGHTMVILDECHTALNITSNTGKVVRKFCEGAGRVMFASATFLRDYKGSDLYNYCLPPALQHTTDSLYNVPSASQEYMTTMLIEDGVYLRRDHDLMDVPRKTLLPNEGETGQNRIIADSFRKLGQNIARFRAQFRREFRHYTLTNPLPHLATSIVNQNKIAQTVRIAREAINRGRKPQIFISETGGTWMEHLRRETGDADPNRTFSFKDYIRFKVGQLQRGHSTTGEPAIEDVLAVGSDQLRAIMAEIETDIAGLPDHLPPSPIDALRQGLEENDITVGELTGRTMQFDAQSRLEARPMSRDQDRSTIGEAYNDGMIDVIIFNRTVSTGHSYHADPSFGDQRPRSIIIMDTDQNIVDSLQSEGRGNRFNQTSIPEILIVSTGLAAEMRKISYYNRKLHSLGAIVDSNRDHPALQDSIPDMCNSVGEEAVRRTLQDDAFEDLTSMIDPGWRAQEHQWADGIERTTGNGHGLVTTMLNLLPFLEEDMQQRFLNHVVHEYELHQNELDEKGLNPLKTRSLEGYVTLDDSSRFFMDENDLTGDENESAFSKPSEIHNAQWHRPYPMGINVIREQAALNRRRIVMDPPAQAEHIRTLNALQPEPVMAGTINTLIDEVRILQPGTVIQKDLVQMGIVLDYTPPSDRDSHLWLSHGGHLFTVILAGDERPSTYTLGSLTNQGFKPIGNILQDQDNRLATLFQSVAGQKSVRPVQLITGNALKLKTNQGNRFRIMNVRLANGQSTLAAVNTRPNTFSYNDQPVGITARTLWAGWREGGGKVRQAIQYRRADKDSKRLPQRFIALTMLDRPHDTSHLIEATMPNLTREACKRFWDVDTGHEIYQLMTGNSLQETLPAIKADIKAIRQHPRTLFDMAQPADTRRLQTLLALLDQHGEVRLTTSGKCRDWLQSHVTSRHQTALVTWEGAKHSRKDITDLMNRARRNWHQDNRQNLTQPVLALSGRSLPGQASLALTGEDWMLVTLPAYTKANRSFWAHDCGRELWQAVTGRSLPKRTPREARPLRLAVPVEQSETILSALIRNAEQMGINVVIPGDLAVNKEPVEEPLAMAI